MATVAQPQNRYQPQPLPYPATLQRGRFIWPYVFAFLFYHGIALLAFLLLLVPAGFFALTWHARLVHFRAQALGFLAFLFRPDLHRRLRARQHALQAELDALARMVPVAAETRL